MSCSSPMLFFGVDVVIGFGVAPVLSCDIILIVRFHSISYRFRVRSGCRRRCRVGIGVMFDATFASMLDVVFVYLFDIAVDVFNLVPLGAQRCHSASPSILLFSSSL